MAKNDKEDCCERFLRKGGACKDCPLLAPLTKKKRKKLIKLSKKMRKLLRAA